MVFSNNSKYTDMKISHYLFLSVLITFLAACASDQKKADSKAIIGVWQNTSTPNAAIEFTEDGEYFLRLNDERLLTNDSTVEKYSYDPLSDENNLIIYGNTKMNTTQAKLVVIDPERIKISLIHQGSIVSEAEFTKVGNQ